MNFMLLCMRCSAGRNRVGPSARPRFVPWPLQGGWDDAGGTGAMSAALPCFCPGSL